MFPNEISWQTHFNDLISQFKIKKKRTKLILLNIINLKLKLFQQLQQKNFNLTGFINIVLLYSFKQYSYFYYIKNIFFMHSNSNLKLIDFNF